MKYQIWNHTDSIITPSGAQFTAEQWAEQFPWVDLPGVKMIITTPPINGGVALEFNSYIEQAVKHGLILSDNMTDDEILAALEDFEDHPPSANEASPEERIAAALEAQAMLAEPEAASTFSITKVSAASAVNERSPAFERVKRNYKRGLWSAYMLQVAVGKGRITSEEADMIINE